MNTLEKKKADRFKFLKTFYDQADGNTRCSINMWELGEALGFDRTTTDTVVQYLIGEHLIEPIALGGSISLTHDAVREIEQALENPEQPTHYFPPAVNIINIHGDMVNSSVQQAGSHSKQTSTVSQAELQSFLVELRRRVDDLELAQSDKSDLIADVDTVELQLKKTEPRPVIVKESLGSVRRVLEGAAGNLVASGLLEQLSRISF